MKLSGKLVIMSFFTILIPMLLVVFFAAFIIFRNTALSQWEYLEAVEQHIQKEMTKTAENYLREIKLAAHDDFIRAKLYVYEKYWHSFSESLIAYDLESLANQINSIVLENDIETFAVYRREQNLFQKVNSTDENKYLPDTIYKQFAEQDYNKVIYQRSPEGIYMRVLYPVFSDGKLVGLLLFMRSYDEVFLHSYTDIYNIDIALISKNKIMSNTDPSAEQSIFKLVNDTETAPRRSFKVGSRSFTGLIYHFELSSTATGYLVLYNERTNLLNENRSLLVRLLLLTLLCVMIPVVAFFIKEIRLIRAINSLVSATDDISSGNYNTAAEIISDDEIGMLSRNFNTMVGVLKTNRDALQQQNSELELKNSYIDAVFQSLRINIIVLDADRCIRVVSRNAGSRLELNDDYQGKDLLSVEPFKSAGAILEGPVSEVYGSGNFARLYSVSIGNTSFEADFYPVVDDEGIITAVVIILNNITERMTMERALMRSDKLASVGTLAAGLAHEINNPLGIILNHVQLVGSGALNQDQEKRFIERIESEIKRVSRLINNLLKFSREETSAVERLNPGLLLAEVIGLLDPKTGVDAVDSFYNGIRIVPDSADCYAVNFKGKHVGIFLTEAILCEHIKCSRDSLKQIFFNILKNSLDSCAADDGIIWCHAEREADGLRIEISDNGRGIADKEKVFEIFYTNSKTGSGIGLPLCRNLMNNMGGTINLDDSEGGGTRIILKFPIREDYYGEI